MVVKENRVALIREETSDFNISCLSCSLTKLHLVFFWSIRMSVSPPRKDIYWLHGFCAFSREVEGDGAYLLSCRLVIFKNA